MTGTLGTVERVLSSETGDVELVNKPVGPAGLPLSHLLHGVCPS